MNDTPVAQNDEDEQQLFERTFSEPALKASFKAFCATSKIDESLVFLDTVAQFKAANSDCDRFQLAAQIVTQFVKVGAPYEVNISSDSREQCVSQFFKACAGTSCPADLFDNVNLNMLVQLRSEHFPRFLRSPFFESYKKGKNEFKEAFEDRDAENKSFLYEVTDFSTPNLGEDDFRRVISLARPNDDMWKQVLKRPDMISYVSKNTFEVEKKKGLRLCKIVSEYDCNARDLFNTYFTPEFRPICEKGLASTKLIDYIKKSDKFPFPIAVIQERYKLIWPLSDRDFVFCTSVRYEKDKKRYVVARKTTKHPKAPPVKSVVRGLCIGGLVIDQISELRSRVTQVAYTDFAGYIPTKFWNKIIAARGDDSHVALLKVLAQQKKKQYPAAADSQGFYETLAENSMVSVNSPTSPISSSPSPVSAEQESPRLFNF